MSQLDSLNNKILPIDSLWSVESLTLPMATAEGAREAIIYNSPYITSIIALAITLLFLIFFREVKDSFKLLFNGLFFFSRQLSIEERVSAARARDITALLSILIIPLIISFRFGPTLFKMWSIRLEFFIGIFILFLVAYRVVKWLLLKLLTLLFGEPLLFRRILKVGDNHFTLALFFTIPIVIESLTPFEGGELLTIKYLLIVYGALALLYFFRILQLMRLHSFSHLFYILYLCTIEVGPIALLMYLFFQSR